MAHDAGTRLTFGHHHLNVSRTDAHLKFWVQALGGKVTSAIPSDNVTGVTGVTGVIEFSNVSVFLTVNPPTGGTKGTTINHVAFEVPSLRPVLDSVRAAGFPLVTRAELASKYEVNDDIGYVTALDHYVAFVMGPDGTKVEFLEVPGMAGAIAFHHVHFAAIDVASMKAWYVATFDARAGNRGPFEAADLPGVNLTWSPSTTPVVGTQGRALDHIAFEVTGLDDFCRQLASKNITFAKPYAGDAAGGYASAMIVDPWGTQIELTEGMGSR